MNKRKALEPKTGPSEKAVPGLVPVCLCTQSSQLIQPLVLAPLPLALLLRLKLSERVLPTGSPRERPAGRSTVTASHAPRTVDGSRGPSPTSRSHLYDDPCGAVRCPRVNGRPGLFERLVPNPLGGHTSKTGFLKRGRGRPRSSFKINSAVVSLDTPETVHFLLRHCPARTARPPRGPQLQAHSRSCPQKAKGDTADEAGSLANARRHCTGPGLPGAPGAPPSVAPGG